MESPVEIRYAGVVIGRAQEVRSADGDSESYFLVAREPMPVGSVLHLRTGDRETPARVIHTVESTDPTACGIQVRLIGEAEEVATEWIPPPPVVVEKARPVEGPVKNAMAVIEVRMSDPQSTSVPETRLESLPEVLLATAAETEFGFSTPAVAETEQSAVESSVTTQTSEPVLPPPSDDAVPEPIPVASVWAVMPESESVTEDAPAVLPSEPAANTGEEVEPSIESAAVAEEPPLAENLPPARPISGPSGRRKTKRRR